MSEIKLDYISQINLSTFSIFLSMLLAFFILFVFFGQGLLRLEISQRSLDNCLLFSVFCIALLSSVGFLIRFDIYHAYGSMAFLPWTQIPLFDLFLISLSFCCLLFFPGLVLHRLLFSKYRLDFMGKLVFYPLLSMFSFGFLGFVLPSFLDIIYLKFLFPIMFASLLLIFSVHNLKTRKFESAKSVSVDMRKYIGLFLIIMFAFVILYSVVGETSAFLRGDAARTVENIGFMNKYGLSGYLNAPLTEHYPVFFFSSWSAITKFLPFPYVNTMLIVEFFNLAFMILAFFLLAKSLFKSMHKSLLSTLFFVVLSGFALYFVLVNPPASPLSGNDFSNYVGQLFNKIGTESGAKLSYIYADDHALIRLWSSGVTFASLSAIVKYFAGQRKRFLLVLFSIGLTSIALGHSAEVTLISLALLALIIITGNLDKNLFFATGLSTLLIVFISWLFGYPNVTYFAALLPVLLLVFAALLKKLVNSKYVKFVVTIFSGKRILDFTVFICVLFYGLSWIAFIIYEQTQLVVPFVTLWYSIPIQLGFLGLLFIVTMVKNSLTNWENLDLGYKFSMLLLFLLLVFVMLVNYSNCNLYYLSTPTFVMPYYFLPFLALGSADIIRGSNVVDKALVIRAKSILPVFLIVLLLLSGSFSHVISASYWNTAGWWKEDFPSSFLSDEDVDLVNFLYAVSPKLPYETADFLPENQPFPLVEDLQFQKKIRYKTYEEHHLIFLSGTRIPQKLSMSVLFDAQNLDEITFLEQIYPIRYVLADKNASSFIAEFMKDADSLIFNGDEYVVYDLSSFLMPQTSNQKIEKIILVDEVSFIGNLTFIDGESKENSFNNAFGTLLPLENGLSLIGVYAGELNPNLTDQEIDDNKICVYDDNESLWKVTGLGLGNLTAPILSEEKSEKVKGSSSLKLEMPTSGIYELACAYQAFSAPYLNWSGKDFICIDLYGLNNNGTITVTAYGGGDSGHNARLWYLTDNFLGWRHFILPINNPNYSGKNFNETSVNRIGIRWNTPGIRFVDRMIIDAFTNIPENISNVEIEGNTTLLNLRSTWQYFPETNNVAQKVSFNGTVMFTIMNTFGNKSLYIEPFEYLGDMQAFPETWHLSASNSKQTIQSYIKNADVPFLEVMITYYGLTWTAICIFYLHALLIKRRKRQLVATRNAYIPEV